MNPCLTIEESSLCCFVSECTEFFIAHTAGLEASCTVRLSRDDDRAVTGSLKLAQDKGQSAFRQEILRQEEALGVWCPGWSCLRQIPVLIRRLQAL